MPRLPPAQRATFDPWLEPRQPPEAALEAALEAVLRPRDQSVVPIPNLSYVIAWPQGMDTTHVTLASGTTFSMHGDSSPRGTSMLRPSAFVPASTST